MIIENNIELTIQRFVELEGWIGKYKGFLQILWDHMFIIEDKMEKYSKIGKKLLWDENGIMKQDYEKYVLHTMMWSCADFKE